jgi:hypothetical protein
MGGADMSPLFRDRDPKPAPDPDREPVHPFAIPDRTEGPWRAPEPEAEQ